MRLLFFLILLPNIIINNAVIAQDDDKARFRSIWEKDKIHINISVPFANYMYMRPPGSSYEPSGVLGVSMGGDLCYTDKRFISLQAGVVNATAPVERFPDSLGWEVDFSAAAFFVNVRHNHALKWLDFGYGLVLSNHMYDYTKRNSDLNIDSSTHYRNPAIGGCVAVYYKIAYFFYAGVLYQPQFLSFANSKAAFKTEHLLSFDIMFRLDMRKRKNNGKTP